MQHRKLRIAATDGYALSANLFEPDGAQANTPLVIISGATGVKQEYYRHYAEFLVESGFRALTYDYRGIGKSLAGHVRNSEATMHDWGEKDMAGVIEQASKALPDAPLLMMAHSVGGQVFGLAANNHKVRALLGIGAQLGYWRLWPFPRRILLFIFWHIAIPLLTLVFGYFPSSRVGLGEDLPPGVARNWARWGRNKHYISDEKGRAIREHFFSYTAPVMLCAIDDDTFAPRPTVQALLAQGYPNAQGVYRHITPDEVGHKKLGHFGFFRRRIKKSYIWRETAQWLWEKV